MATTQGSGVRGLIALARIRGLAEEKNWWGAGGTVVLLDQLWFAFRAGNTDLGSDFPAVASRLYADASYEVWKEFRATNWIQSPLKAIALLFYALRLDSARSECHYRAGNPEVRLVADER